MGDSTAGVSNPLHKTPLLTGPVRPNPEYNA